MKNLFFLVVGMFAMGSSSFMIAGILPEIGETIAQPLSVTAQGITAFTLTYLFSAPFFSLLLSGRSAKRTLQLALVIFLFGNILTFLSESIVTFILGRIIAGLGAGVFNPLCVGIAIQLGDSSKKGQTLSWIWGANSAGVVFGVPLGVFLASKLSWQISISYVIALTLISLIGFSLQNTRVNLPQPPSMRKRLALLVDSKVLSVIGITGFTVLASTGLYSYVSTIHSGSPHSLAMVLFVWGLGGFLGSSSVGFFVDKTRNAQFVMAFVLTGLTLALLAIPFSLEIPFWGLLPFFFWGFFGWATMTPQQHVLFDLHDDQRTLLSALNSSAVSLGSTLGTAIGGLLIAVGFTANNLTFAAALTLVLVTGFHILLMKNFKRQVFENEASNCHC